jgi:hypothetical protein
VGNAQSGGLNIGSGESPSLSGTVTIYTGDSVSSTSGDIVIRTGVATDRGSIQLIASSLQILPFSSSPGGTQPIQLFDTGSVNNISIQAPNSVTTYSLILPATQGGSGTFPQNDGSGNLSWVTPSAAVGTTPNVVYHTLTGSEISAKQITLPGTPYVAANTMLDVLTIGPQQYSVDYTVSSNILSWSGLGLDGTLTSGMVLRILFFT